MKPAKLVSRFGLPLLTKELIEQAARKRTYVLRVLYACLLFFASFLFFYELLRMNSASPFAALGHGREVFQVLMGLQFAGTYLFMPAITCGVLTQEKERNSLMLLFLTRLGPWTIVLEKLLGRLIPMLCFLLLSLPLLAFAYSLGGISATYLWSGIWMLAVTALQMGTLALFCSAWLRTTVGAFIASYLIGLVLLFGPAFLTEVVWMGRGWYNSPLSERIMSLGIYDHFEQPLFPFFAPVQYFSGGATGPAILPLTLRTVPILLSSALFLLMARFFVVRRAFVAPRNALLALFKLVDSGFRRINDNRVTRGIILVRDETPLPVDDPIAWRETSKRSLGRTRYLFRVFVAIEAPLALVCLLVALIDSGSLEGASVALFLLWAVAVLIVAVQAASLIAGERTHQTLDVLATIPLSGREILLQKFRGVRRLMLMFAVPFVTLFVFEAWWHGSFPRHYPWYGHRIYSTPLYLTCSVLSVAIYLPMVAWLSTLIGLVVRTQAKAIVAAVGAIVGWCILPLVFIVMPLVILFQPGGRDSGWSFILLLSPAAIIPFNEFHEMREFASSPWLATGLNFAFYGVMLLLFRHLCLANADRHLGRADSQ